MPIKKRYRQTDGTIVEALFTDDGRQVQINDGNMKLWVPATLDALDMHQPSAAEAAARKADYHKRKAQVEREIAYEKSDTKGIIVDKRAGTITMVETFEMPQEPKPEAKPEIIDLVQNPNKRRR